MGILGALGAPIYVAVNSLNRYFIGTKEDSSEKSAKSYINNLKSSPITHALSALAIAIPAIKAGRANKIFEKNFDKVVDNLKKAELSQQITNGKTSYEQLEDILFENPEINSILNSDLNISEKIQQLSNENIFAVKFKQINTGYDDDLARALKSECPPTRTLEDAQEIINKTFDKKYKVQKCVGVGTVAETYLVKEGDKEYCIKMLKNGINAEKINSDKQKFIEIINSSIEKTPQEKQYLIDNVENIAQGVLQEVDFNNEMNAACELAKVTNKAKLVKPVTVKDGLYVMEKADGIPLSDFAKYNHLKWRFMDFDTKRIITNKEELLEKNPWLENSNNLKEYDKFMELHNLGISDLSEKESEKMLNSYQDIITEQFSKITEKGKTIHGDIHPGNIFIDIDALKVGKQDFFTLIDTGSTIKLSQENALRSLNLSNYIKNADYENIADFVLEGAILPEGLDKTAAREKMVAELKKAFFDNETYTNKITNDSLLSLTDGVMQKLNIIPVDTQGNLIKSKTSASKSMAEFQNNYLDSLEKNIEQKYGDLSEANSGIKALARTELVGKVLKTGSKSSAKNMIQERKNLAIMSPAQKAKLKKSATVPKKNSEEYLTYKLKQYKNPPKKIEENIEKMLGE